MAHLKRSLGISLWFMFLTLPLMVVRVNTVSREVEWRWSNLVWVGICAFAIAWFWQFSIERRAAKRAQAVADPHPEVRGVPDDDVRALVSWLLFIVSATLPLAGYVYLLDGVLIGAGDGAYLAKAGALTVTVYAPVALGALLVAPGQPGMTWLWVSFTVVFMGARALTLGLRARGDGWLTLGGAQPSRRA